MKRLLFYLHRVFTRRPYNPNPPVKIKNITLIPRHYFNNIHFTEYPMYLGLWLFLFVFSFLLYLNKYSYIKEYMLVASLVGLTYVIFQWFYALMLEASMIGRYNRKVSSSLVFGFFLFLLSEIMLFAGFFWSFFDRIFFVSYATFDLSYFNGVELIRWYKVPLVATIVLVASGFTLNYAYYLLKIQSYDYSILFLLITETFAYVFIILQVEEYLELTFTISDNVYCSLFFLLTGFHGMHVLVGTIFILVTHERIYLSHFSNKKMIGFGLALVYWHFVDIIWIFLFFFIYILNNWDFLYISQLNSDTFFYSI